MKRFKDLATGDKIYILEPLSDSVRESKVLRAGRHTKSLTGKVWVVKFLKLSNIKGLTEEKLEDAQRYGTDASITMMVDADETMALVKFPGQQVSVTVISTDEQKLLSWIRKPGKEAAEMLRMLKQSR